MNCLDLLHRYSYRIYNWEGLTSMQRHLARLYATPVLVRPSLQPSLSRLNLVLHTVSRSRRIHRQSTISVSHHLQREKRRYDRKEHHHQVPQISISVHKVGAHHFQQPRFNLPRGARASSQRQSRAYTHVETSESGEGQE